MTAEERIEQRGYARGYSRGRQKGDERARAAIELHDLLVAGLMASGLSLDGVLDLMIEGAKARGVEQAR